MAVAKLSRAIAEELFRKRGIVLIAMILGFTACVLQATCLPNFPTGAFLTFLGPLGLGAYGFRVYRAIKEGVETNDNYRTPEKTDPLL